MPLFIDVVVEVVLWSASVFKRCGRGDVVECHCF